MSRRALLAALPLLAAPPLLAMAAPALATPLHDYADLAVSDDGTRLATVEKVAEPADLTKAHGAIVVRDGTSGHVLARLDPCKACGYGDLSYGPAGQLAFVLRDRQAGTASLMVATGTAKPRKLATVKGLAAVPRWSPDGTRIALLVTEGATKETGAAQAGAREVGEIGDRYDEKRIAIVPAAGGALRMVSPADRFVYEYDWTPDGRGFVATSARGNGDANWWVATVDAIDAASGAVRTIVAPTTQANFPRISPDGRTVAYIGGLMSDFGSVGGDVWTVPFAGGAATNVTPGYKGSFTSLSWDQGGLRGVALLGDQAAVVPVDPGKGPAEPVWTAAVSTSAANGAIAFAQGGTRMAMVAQDFEHAAALFAGPTGHPVQISTDNAAIPAITSARSIRWKSGGFDVQGWLLAPLGVPAGGGAKAPMIVEVHGGPAAAHRPRFVGGQDADLLKAGYWLFLPNPRGSYGQGEAFTQANRRDFGGGDLGDILAGIDAVERQAPVDEARLGLMGGSYGGFMSMWANTQTHRFKAIWAAAGLSNWISYYGTNGINAWMLPYFGKSAYDDQKAYWDVSAIQFIKQARTPTLITVGERDIEVPPTQSVEYWNGLKAAGVPASLIIYPDEGHGIRQPDHQADQRRRVLDWFDHYLKGQ